jgi:acetoin utilization deacetylase AcuC-like enzyme
MLAVLGAHGLAHRLRYLRASSMKCAYHPGYHLPLPIGFPISKHPLLKDRLLAEGVLASADLLVPEALDLRHAALVHTAAYLAKLQGPGLSAAEERKLGMPWSQALWMRARLAAGGTLLAARTAFDEGLAGNLAGGAHHAFPDHGEGFCVLNDVAIAACVLRSERAVRIAIIDLDVHQGNGTAAIFANVEEVFTFSMHGERNYPLAKMRSSLDVALGSGTGDAEYLALLERCLPEVLDRSRPDIAFYLAGVDVAAGDRYGKLGLSDEGIRGRDRWVVESVRDRGVPLVIVLAGGYAQSPARTAELHAHVFREAVKCERRIASPPSGLPVTAHRP